MHTVITEVLNNNAITILFLTPDPIHVGKRDCKCQFDAISAGFNVKKMIFSYFTDLPPFQRNRSLYVGLFRKCCEFILLSFVRSINQDVRARCCVFNVTDGTDVEVTASDALGNLKIAAACLQSHRTGQPVKLN